jgi:methionyl-tRNA formyltransferase
LLQHTMIFDGTELYEEIRSKQAFATINIVEQFLQLYPRFRRRKQTGVPSFYRKRNLDNSELDSQKSIENNFNLLRLSNNEEWPSFFFYKKQKFIVKICRN